MRRSGITSENLEGKDKSSWCHRISHLIHIKLKTYSRRTIFFQVFFMLVLLLISVPVIYTRCCISHKVVGYSHFARRPTSSKSAIPQPWHLLCKRHVDLRFLVEFILNVNSIFFFFLLYTQNFEFIKTNKMYNCVNCYTWNARCLRFDINGNIIYII